MLVFPCAKCAKQLQTKQEMAGKKVKCPRCGQEVVVPAAVSVEDPGADRPPANSAPVRAGHSLAPAPLPPQSAAAAPDEAITAEELCRLIQENKPVPPHVIKGNVNLADLKYDHKLSLRDCTFQGPVEATQSHFLHTVDLSGCTFEQGISFAGAWVDHLIAPNCTFRGPFDASEARFDQSVDLSKCVFEKEIKFPGARIAGNLVLTDAAIRGTEACFELATIEGNLLAQGLQTQTTLDFTNASVRGRTDFSRGHTGEIFLNGTTLLGDVILNEAELTGLLKLHKATIRGNLLGHGIRLRQAPGSEGGGHLSGLTVSGKVAFDKSHIEGTLDLQATEIRGGLFCQGADIRGYLKLSEAKISGIATLNGSRFGQGLNLVTAVVEGSLLLDPIFVGPQEPEPGAAALESSTPEQGRPPADGTGHVLAYGLRVTNYVFIKGARIRGHLRLDGATLGATFRWTAAASRAPLVWATRKSRRTCPFNPHCQITMPGSETHSIYAGPRSVASSISAASISKTI